jgi:hypothetical protein
MDYQGWLNRLQQFVEKWRAKAPPDRQAECSLVTEPPLTAADIQRLGDELDCHLPDSAANFLTQAASRVVAHCVCATSGGILYAGGDLFNYWLWRPEQRDYWTGCLEGMVEARQDQVDFFDAGWRSDPEWVLDRAFHRHALPLLRLPTTDCLALWAHSPDEAEPAVIFVSHDGPSCLLAPNFDTFLQQWEYLGYAWSEEDHEPTTGVLLEDAPTVRRRRELLGLS